VKNVLLRVTFCDTLNMDKYGKINDKNIAQEAQKNEKIKEAIIDPVGIGHGVQPASGNAADCERGDDP